MDFDMDMGSIEDIFKRADILLELQTLNQNVESFNEKYSKIEQIKELLEALKELDSDNKVSLKVIEEIEALINNP